MADCIDTPAEVEFYAVKSDYSLRRSTAQLALLQCILHKFVLETAWQPSDDLTAAMYSTVHGSDRRVVYDLHITVEVGVSHNLASGVSVY